MNVTANQFLAKEPVGKLMLKFSIPCILSLLVSALYNIVDQIFIGQGIGYLGNGATNVVFPITIIALAFGLMIGDGCAANLSICQGKNNQKAAAKCVGNAVAALVVAGVALMLLFYVLKEPILWGFGATENNIAYAREYFDWIVLGIPFFIFANGMNSVIRADGSPKFAMFTILSGCIINVVLDPIAIFVLDFGMAGAAIATILGQFVTAAFAFYYLFHAKSFHFQKRDFFFSVKTLKSVFSLGISSFLTQISIVIIMAVMNNALVHYGAQSKYGEDIPLTVVGIVMKVFQIVIAIVVGIAAGAQPIVGYNYGAGRNDRVKEIYKKMIAAEICLGIVTTFCFEVFPLQIINIFGSESGLYSEFAVMAFRIYLCTMILCCVQKSTSIFLQALGKPMLSMSLSLLRDFALMIPLILLLAANFGIAGTLYSAPIADGVSMIVVLVFVKYIFKHLSSEKEEVVLSKSILTV